MSDVAPAVGPRWRSVSDLAGIVAEISNRTYQAPSRLIGLALLRVGIGVGSLITYLGDWSWRHELYKTAAPLAAGDIPGEASISDIGFNLYGLASEYNAPFELVWGAGFVVAIAFTVVGGRVLSLLQLVFISSLHAQNVLVLDGGDNVASLLLKALPFAMSSAYLSPLGARTRRRIARTESSPMFLVHNTAVAVCVVQVAFVYLIASLWKISGLDWQNGTAFAIISRGQDLGLIDAASGWGRSALVTGVLTWATVAIQLFFALGVLVRWRFLPALMLAIVAMHVGIVTYLGLVSFGVAMIAADCVCLPDRHYRAASRWWADRGHRRVSNWIGAEQRRVARGLNLL